MAKSFTIASGAQVPASNEGARLGGSLAVAILTPASLAGTTYDIEASYDDGTTWVPVVDEDNTARQLTLTSTSAMVQLNPAVFAPRLRLNSDTNETGDRVFHVFSL